MDNRENKDSNGIVRIVSSNGVMLGQPVIEGTRITVKHVLTRLADGETREQLLQAHPNLSNDGISAALRYAATEILGAPSNQTQLQVLYPYTPHIPYDSNSLK